jgi:hypothetical protein
MKLLDSIYIRSAAAACSSSCTKGASGNELRVIGGLLDAQAAVRMALAIMASAGIRFPRSTEAMFRVPFTIGPHPESYTSIPPSTRHATSPSSLATHLLARVVRVGSGARTLLKPFQHSGKSVLERT